MKELRLWHQSLTDLSLLPSYRSSLESHCAKVAPPDVHVDLHGVRRGTYTSRYPGARIQQVYLQSLHKEQFVSAALQAEAAGYDGMIIATIPDLALEECRALVDIPVVGFGEASFKLGSMFGDIIGVLSFDIRHLEPQLRRNAHRYGLERLVGPMVSAGAEFDDVIEELGSDRPGPVIESVVAAGRELVEGGAQVIVPGPGPMNLLTSKHGLNRIDDVPVIDSLRSAIELCALLARMARDGTYVNRRGFYYARPDREQVAEAREVYGLATGCDGGVGSQAHK